MTLSELATAVVHKLAVKVVIMNNHYLGMVRQWQEMFYDNRLSGIDLDGNPDFVKLAEAYGAAGIRVNSMEDFQKAVKTALSNKVTTVIDVPIGSEEDVVPFVPPGCGLPQQKGDY